MTKRGKTVPLFVDGSKFAGSAHADIECVMCHEGFKADEIPHAKRIKPVDCMTCHSGDQFAGYHESVHGKARKDGKPVASCADCHTTHAIANISGKDLPARKEFAAQVCSGCHRSVSATFMASDHGKALAGGVKGAPTCIDCHGEHTIASPLDEAASTNRTREAKMCLSCHQDNPDVRAKVGPSAGFIASYEQSVHGQAIQHGNGMAATCSDCHGSHQMKKGSDQTSKVAKGHIAETCGQCHGDVQQEFDASIHGVALARGITASPTCTDCHGEHNILSPKDSRSPVSAGNVSAAVCSPCHGSLKLNEKYGLAGNRFESFKDSYHGLAGRSGSVEVANCASCHGVHDIKPSTDPSSRIHPANLVSTCGSCHPGANENFTRGAVHVIASSGDDAILYFVATTYIILIIVTIGGMALHNILDFVKKSKVKLMERRGLVEHHRAPNRLHLRMSLSERIQHGILLVSFTVLVLTGFALRYPDAWWVVPIRDLSPMMFDLRSLMHRIAGVAMVLVSFYHIYYLLAVPRGKQLLRDLLPVTRDLRDLTGVFKYYVGLSTHKPKFGRFSYIEKAEYWALVWGTFVMAATGFILWFDNTFMGLITKLGWDVARTIHFYEAWLATLAILVWHLYFVIFNPEVYPINLAFWKGTLTEQEMAEEHPLELEEIKRKELALRLEEQALKEGNGSTANKAGRPEKPHQRKGSPS